ncbi:MAG: hypothetical protein A2268_10460 [Candidatus Raymondbacteria bacterium RifOxyA12_full_50_37]|uniref:Potassium channel protein n=1 Tax=Candidatus Raymondbacteria bacterium RIFOXYD12_FULL_49_13 TaxID=1817890 RepID=A0A1F7FKC9_UNCRA|nr:MAG: hypothetical protein A2268_10460 [Candidatus Raymondbacteria bacterium RifOxyA12_full_50_37]OGJ90178.1 MAG: hypothetical protein A2248_16940 [Candidatus Raymondbacteria bacterium RIFOXYA2_FULL_49_16]OGJ97250.1 MAG: hypothetical protein A2453_01430 [Candidatus Raymondbacteria bacterium RIFOXYC2_FULL_50_21]OGJ98833.1 MAG: hypothetical protein A2350_21550 [Candidatus Raymondbacteria bacterium RifOxyB12_full_50_8]OGK07120.1 MAG: hypothetical protein A2519_09160 [Candidatus Raymondbacteria b
MSISEIGLVPILLTIILCVAIASVAGSLTALLAQGAIRKYLGRTRMEHELKKIRNHCIICGYGRMGRTIARQFEQQQLPLVIVDPNDAAIASAREQGHLAIHGDMGAENVLREAGADRAKALVIASANDALNLMVALTARTINKSLLIVARAEGPETEKKLRMVGTDKVITPHFMGALRIAQAVMRPAAFNFVETSTLSTQFGLTIDEFPIGPESPLAGKSILQSNIKNTHNIIILAITDHKGEMNFNPPAGTVIKSGAKLILMGDRQSIDRLAEFTGIKT